MAAIVKEHDHETTNLDNFDDSGPAARPRAARTMDAGFECGRSAAGLKGIGCAHPSQRAKAKSPCLSGKRLMATSASCWVQRLNSAGGSSGAATPESAARHAG